LQQALLNYATNAIKFTETGGVKLHVALVDEDDYTALIRFEVIDTGIGIAQEAISRLFQVFEQADNSTTRKYGGTGLGLAITRKLAKLMGGDAGAHSQLGQGSTFWFSARLKKAHASDSTEQIRLLDAEMLLHKEFEGVRVLLVEDEPVNREITLMMLGDVGLASETAVDGIEAVRLATENDFALILMDMQMPRMDGLEATRQIRQLPQYANTPIIAMTANAFAEDKGRCFAAGMNDFLSKPVNPGIMYEVLLKHLRQGRAPG
jgi:CheY-like chemotaxis protein